VGQKQHPNIINQ